MGNQKEELKLTDEELSLLVQQGDYEIFGTLIDRYEEKIKRYLSRFLQNSAEIDDLSQDVFLKAFENIQGFDPKRRFSPWLYQIAHNELVNFLKKKKLLNSQFLSVDWDVFLPHEVINNKAIEEINNKFQLTAIEQALPQLSFKYQQVFVLYYYEHLNYQEISEILKIPVATVGIRLKRAKDFLKEIINHNSNGGNIKG